MQKENKIHIIQHGSKTPFIDVGMHSYESFIDSVVAYYSKRYGIPLTWEKLQEFGYAYSEQTMGALIKNGVIISNPLLGSSF